MYCLSYARHCGENAARNPPEVGPMLRSPVGSQLLFTGGICSCLSVWGSQKALLTNADQGLTVTEGIPLSTCVSDPLVALGCVTCSDKSASGMCHIGTEVARASPWFLPISHEIHNTLAKGCSVNLHPSGKLIWKKADMEQSHSQPKNDVQEE